MTNLAAAAVERAKANLQVAHDALTAAQATRVSIPRILLGAAAQKFSGREREFLEETARIAGKSFDPTRVVLPYAVLASRALDATGPLANGPALVGTETSQTVVPFLRPFDPSIGQVKVFEGLTSNLVLPRQTGTVTEQWLTGEETGPSETEPTVGQITMIPKNVSARLSISRQLEIQSASAEAFAVNDLRKTAATILLKARYAGSGASGQPQGVIGASGVTSVSGVNLSWPGALALQAGVCNANAVDLATSWVMTPNVRAALAGRDKATASGRFIVEDDQIAGRPAYVTTALPPGTLICGDASQIAIGLWGPGIEIGRDPYTNFASGIVALRVFLSCDVAVLEPAAFQIATGTT